MIGARSVCVSFYTAHDLPRRFKMIGFKTLLADISNEGRFPFLFGGGQYADRKMLLCDSVREDVTRRNLTRCCGIQLGYPLRCSLDHGVRVVRTPLEVSPQRAFSRFRFPRLPRSERMLDGPI